MKKHIARYPGYSFLGNDVYSPTGNKLKLSKEGKYRVVDASGRRTSVSPGSIKEQLGPKLILPEGSVPIPNTSGEYFISKDARVFSFNRNRHPQGYELI